MIKDAFTPHMESLTPFFKSPEGEPCLNICSAIGHREFFKIGINSAYLKYWNLKVTLIKDYSLDTFPIFMYISNFCDLKLNFLSPENLI